ncbi:MAG: transcription elongation factor GreA [Spirochaetaceae bacterium]|nr:transcription elongation factor GreA [Spirochaetaceae bacterium]
MSDNQLTGTLQGMLNEEKWTRTTLPNYSIASLKELDALLESAAAQNCSDEFLNVCQEHLGHTKNSVIALYIAGILSLAKQPADESYLVQLMDLFAESGRTNIVEYLCQRILDYGENRIALSRLADCYQAENRTDELYETRKRLIKVDYEEADIVKAIAEHEDKLGQRDEAIGYYKKALLRYINKGLSTNVREIWLKLVAYCPEDIDFFFHVEKKIATQISQDKAAMLLMDLYAWYKDKKDWDTALDILKHVIDYDDKSPAIRKELIECYSGKYAGHSRLQDYLKLANISQSYRSLHEAIDEFEKHIAFDVGNYVFHRTWNIGRIASVKGDEVTIDFAKSRNHKMSLKMAIDSLIPLSKDHIWVLKATWPKDKLHEKVKNDPVWALKTIIKSFDNRADLKRVKAELVPNVLTQSEWNAWGTKAKDALKTDSSFGNAANDISMYIVRERPLSFDEKLFIQFKAEKNFFPRVQCFRDFIEKNDLDSEYFAEMLSYFSSFLNAYQGVDEFVVSSFLLLKDLAIKNPRLQQNPSITFQELFLQIENPVAVYQNIKDSELKTTYVQHIRLFIPEWSDIYIKLLPYARSVKMIDELKDAGYSQKLKKMAMDIVEDYRDHREAFIWLVKDLRNEEWFSELGIVREKIMLTLLHILDITYKEIDNHKDTTENKKVNKLVQNILFKDKYLENFLLESTPDTVERVYALLMDIREIDPSIKLDIKHKISEKFPKLRYFGEEEKLTVLSRGLMVTAEKYEEKQKLLQTIMETDVPQNQKEIAFALSLGDLRENAEYKAAKEKQDELNAKVGKLKNELDRAQIFDRTTITTSKISFGTKVVLLNEINKEKETYIILGPWESDPAADVISYLSPLGKKLMGHKVGEELKFTIHERDFQYRIESIVEAQF